MPIAYIYNNKVYTVKKDNPEAGSSDPFIWPRFFCNGQILFWVRYMSGRDYIILSAPDMIFIGAKILGQIKESEEPLTGHP